MISLYYFAILLVSAICANGENNPCRGYLPAAGGGVTLPNGETVSSINQLSPDARCVIRDTQEKGRCVSESHCKVAKRLKEHLVKPLCQQDGGEELILCCPKEEVEEEAKGCGQISEQRCESFHGRDARRVKRDARYVETFPSIGYDYGRYTNGVPNGVYRNSIESQYSRGLGPGPLPGHGIGVGSQAGLRPGGTEPGLGSIVGRAGLDSGVAGAGLDSGVAGAGLDSGVAGTDLGQGNAGPDQAVGSTPVAGPQSQTQKVPNPLDPYGADYPDTDESDFLEMIAEANYTIIPQGKYPHMASIAYLLPNNTLNFTCGAFLIDHCYLVAAAHCFDTIPQYARVGGRYLVDKSVGKYDFPIDAVLLHPDYKMGELYNDIALLRLSRCVPPIIPPACLWTTDFIEFETLFTAGYQETNDSIDSSRILEAELDLHDEGFCMDLYAAAEKIPKGIIPESQLCAGQPVGEVCVGDFGGPIGNSAERKFSDVKVPYVMGVFSFGAGCGLGPGVIYTRISAYLCWIEDVVWSKNATDGIFPNDLLSTSANDPNQFLASNGNPPNYPNMYYGNNRFEGYT